MDRITVKKHEHVALVEIINPPNNFLDPPLVADIADVVDDLGKDTNCRAIILKSSGKHFSAGANLAQRIESGSDTDFGSIDRDHMYASALRLVASEKPLIAAIQGAAIGAGLGLAMIADFRVASHQARFSANFCRQGLHPGFGLSVTLPRVLGIQRAAWLMYSGQRIDGAEALAIGLVDRLVAPEALQSSALEMATEISRSGPQAVVSTRSTLRGDLPERFEKTVADELRIQNGLRKTEDFREGVMAMKERRLPTFQGK